jgi:hypothetical protein
MRYWGRNIQIDGTKVRVSVHNEPLRLIDNTPEAAESYEVRAQNRLRQISTNQAGGILLDAIAAQPRIVTLKPCNMTFWNKYGAEAEAVSDSGAKGGGGSAVTIWYDPMFFAASNMTAKDPGSHIRADDTLFHECVHAYRQALGVWRNIEMPLWTNREEFYAVMMTNIYLSSGRRDFDRRGNYDKTFVAMAPSLGDAAFYSAYSSELNQFRSDAIQFCAKIVAMALGWNPLRAGDAIFWRSLSPGFGIFDQLSGTGHI